MQQKESYDVLRLIEHGQICYISSENVQGRTLARYLKYHPVMEKKELFLLLKAIAEQLELIHRCRGNPCYQYPASGISAGAFGRVCPGTSDGLCIAEFHYGDFIFRQSGESFCG